MRAFLRAIGRGFYVIGSLVFWGAAEVYATIAPWAPTYLRALAITAGLWLALIPTLVIVKVLTGWVPAAYLAAFLAVVLSAILGFLGTPLGILVGLLLGQGAAAGTRYVRLVGVVLFTELMLSLYLLLMPLHHNLGAVPLLILAAVAAGIGTALWGGWLSGKFYTGVAVTIVIACSLSFLFPEVFRVIGTQGGAVDQRIASEIVAHPMRLLFWGAGLLILAAHVAARASNKAWLKAAAWGLVLLVLVLAAIDRLVWGPGLAAVIAPPPAAAPLGEIERREIPLEPPGAWVPVAPLPPWRIKVDQRHVRGMLEIRYNDGREVRVGPDDKLTLPRTLYPTALKGEGIGLIWLCPPPSQACE